MLPPEVETAFRELFRDLAIAWRSLASYPAGHPLVVTGLSGATQALERLLARTGAVQLVATRDALLYRDRLFAEPGPARLATLLRRRRAAAMAFRPGVTASELERLLRGLALESRAAASAPPLSRELVEAGVESIVVSDLDFSTLVLVEGDSGAAEEDLWTRLARRLFREGELLPERVDQWMHGGGTMAGLLRAMLSGSGAGSDGSIAGGGMPGGPSGRAGDPGGGDSVRGDGTERADTPAPRSESGAPRSSPPMSMEERVAQAAASLYAEGAGADPRELAELAGWMRPEGRDRLARELERALATRADGGESLAALFAALPQEIAEAMRAALVKHDRVEPPRASSPDPAHLARLQRTLATADIDILAEETPPSDARAVLLELVGEENARIAPASLEGEFESGGIARAVAASLLELAERPESSEAALVNLLGKVEGAYRTLLAAGRPRLALELVERIQRRAKRDDAPATQFRRVAERLATRESIGALAGSLAELSPEGVKIARQLVERLGPTAARHLLGLLAESEDRDHRRRLLDLLAELGPLVVRDATGLLADPRWYVVRNVLLLLRRVGDPGSLPAIRKCAEHPDLRVRLEAIRNLFAFDEELPRELLRRVFQHRDPRIAGEAIDLAGEHRMVEAGELLAELLARRDPFGTRRPARLKAIRALADIGEPAHLEGLRRFAARFTLLPVAREERVAFFRALSSYPPEAQAPWIERGRRSGDPEIRRLAAELDSKRGAASEGAP